MEASKVPVGATDMAPTSGYHPSSSSTTSSTGPFGVHELVGDVYRIDTILGIGGMGVVYEATDMNLPRRVALKAPRHLVFANALHTEAQALAAIRHPAFPMLHHYGTHGSIPYLTMERIFGETLESRIVMRREAHRPFAILEVIDLLAAVADGLAAAHRMSIAHRDLKPSNILLSGERVVLIDLGLFIPEPLVGPKNVTAGSLQSIAPEVVLGSVVRGNGPRIDLYALGALGHELLTGVPPFEGDTTASILAKHVSDEIPDPRNRRADIPAPLAEIVCELLAKDPFDRPENSEAVVWRLEEMRRTIDRTASRTTRPPPHSTDPPRSTR